MEAIKEPIHVMDSSFEKTVLQSDLPVIVDFWATWCTPCKMVAPILEKFAREYAGRLIVAKVDTDSNQKYAMQYDVQGIPTLLFISKGKVLHKQVGLLPEPMLRTALDEFLSVAESQK